MKNWLSQLFSDSGAVSAMRVMSVSTCFSALIIAFKDPTAVAMVSVLLASAYGGKASQKLIELKNGNKDFSTEA